MAIERRRVAEAARIKAAEAHQAQQMEYAHQLAAQQKAKWEEDYKYRKELLDKTAAHGRKMYEIISKGAAKVQAARSGKPYFG